MPVYECVMTTKVTLNIKADSEMDALDWMGLHSEDDVRQETAAFDIDYDHQVNGEVDEDCGIDISTKED